MTGTWTREQVLALSPDTGSTAAGQKLSSPAAWSETGSDAAAVWGFCKGSGAKPYQTVVDLNGPAFKCSCPSRKFPCKHALGLLLLWSGGGVTAGSRPAYVEEWLAGRSERAGRSASRSAATTPADPAGAAARAAQRQERVRAGLDELDVWLCDQVRGGLSGLQSAGYAPFERMAARMVDAQAPGVAGLLRAVPSQLSGEAWPARALEELALIRLMVQAHRRLGELPVGLAETVRSRIGYSTATESVLAREPVRDRWAALGSIETAEYRLTTRRTWLRGEATGRWGLLLAFAPPGRPLEAAVLPGTTVDADGHFYPGAGQHRVLLGAEHSRSQAVVTPPASTIAETADRFAALVAEDPWANRLPAVLSGVVAPPRQSGAGWWLRDHNGQAVTLLDWRGAPWPLLALSMGDEVHVFGEWSSGGFLPLSCTSAFTTRVVMA